MAEKYTGVYLRVSTRKQTHRSQLPDLQAWVKSRDGPVRWFRDSATGRNMNRPGWSKLENDIRAGKVEALVIWRLDRLGRGARELTALFEELRERKVNLISLREGIDLGTPTGRVVANIMASLAQFEVELKSERIVAGQAAARAAGKRWGGSKKGRRLKVTDLQVKTIRELKTAGEPIAAIARTVGLSRPTIYNVLGNGTLTGTVDTFTQSAPGVVGHSRRAQFV